MDNAGYMMMEDIRSKARSDERPASDWNKNTAGSSKLMSCSVLAVVIACISILVALGGVAIAVRNMTNMAAMQSQATTSMGETNHTVSFPWHCMLLQITSIAINQLCSGRARRIIKYPQCFYSFIGQVGTGHAS